MGKRDGRREVLRRSVKHTVLVKGEWDHALVLVKGQWDSHDI